MCVCAYVSECVSARVCVCVRVRVRVSECRHVLRLARSEEDLRQEEAHRQQVPENWVPTLLKVPRVRVRVRVRVSVWIRVRVLV